MILVAYECAYLSYNFVLIYKGAVRYLFSSIYPIIYLHQLQSKGKAIKHKSLFVVQFMIQSIKYFLFDKSIKRSGLFLSVQTKGKDMQTQYIIGSAVYCEWVGISLQGRIQSSANCRMSNILPLPGNFCHKYHKIELLPTFHIICVTKLNKYFHQECRFSAQNFTPHCTEIFREYKVSELCLVRARSIIYTLLQFFM